VHHWYSSSGAVRNAMQSTMLWLNYFRDICTHRHRWLDEKPYLLRAKQQEVHRPSARGIRSWRRAAWAREYLLKPPVTPVPIPRASHPTRTLSGKASQIKTSPAHKFSPSCSRSTPACNLQRQWSYWFACNEFCTGSHDTRNSGLPRREGSYLQY